MKPILLLDFDGVIHSYKSGWKGAKVIPDPPVPGALEFIAKAMEHFQVCIYSSRSRQWGGKRAMKRWLIGHFTDWIGKQYPEFVLMENPFRDGELVTESIARDNYVSHIKFPTKKPAAFLTIDDRCICFDGTWPEIETIRNFKSWTKKDV